jgi:hypothetical protein
MLNYLKPIRLTAEALSNYDTNLLTSGGIFKFLCSNLEKQNYVFSSTPLKEIRNGLLKRRNKVLISLIKHLSDASCIYGVEEDDFFALANKNVIAGLAKSLMQRLFKGKCALTEELQGEGAGVTSASQTRRC